MDHLLVLLPLLWSSGVQTEGKPSSTEPDDVRLVGGARRCAGTLEVKHRAEWRPLCASHGYFWTLKEAAVFCEHLDCGSAVSVEKGNSSGTPAWLITPDCVRSRSALRACAASDHTCQTLKLTCSDSVRLLNGSSLCSGRLEVKSDQSWSSVCEADFDQQDAEVVCRELGCGPPSVLQGALYGEVEAPVWSREFQCGGRESALLDCRSSGSARISCSPGKAVGLTCSEPDDVRLVGGASRCAGMLELKHRGEWRPVTGSDWTLKEADVLCEHLGCGSAVSVAERKLSRRSVWEITPDCPQFRFALRECATSSYYYYMLNLTCSGRLEGKSDQSWSSVCEADSDQQDAEVVCKGRGCRSPSGLQWAPCGETEPQKAFCSETDDVRLVGGASRCAGTLELKHRGEWRPVFGCDWILGDTADAVCERLHCGPLDYGGVMKSSHRSVWLIRPAQPGSALRECPTSEHSLFILKLTCSDLLVQPIISVSSMDGVSEAQQQGLQVSRGSSFTISCSIQPQYPGGSFQLTFTSSNTASNYTQPAVNHSAHFLFPAAEPTHQGNYSCVYDHVSDHNFSSESRLLAVTVSDPTARAVTAVVLLLILLSVIAALYFYWKASRGQEPSRPESIELVSNDFSVCSAEGTQGAEEELPADHLTS